MPTDLPTIEKLNFFAVEAEARQVDFSRLEPDVGYHVEVPQPSRDDLVDLGFDPKDYMETSPEGIREATGQVEAYENDPEGRERAIETSIEAEREDAFERALEDFRGSDAEDEWRDNFEPMMNYLWPCNPDDPEAAAEAMHEHAPNTCLVTVPGHGDGPETYIGMTAAGTDLSWDVATAYVCCGHIPPRAVMAGMSPMDREARGERGKIVADAAAEASEWFASRSAQMSELSERLRNAAEAEDEPASGPRP